ncbi:MAG: hypothetical protein J0L78_04740 [Planctomycetes bacterium]|nr:hypothetical protein [Planctomycetota bacterium]
MRWKVLRRNGGTVGLAAALVASAGLAASRSHAQVSTWNNGGGTGSWNLATNWSPANIPDGAGESALINLGGTFTITVTGSPSPDSVQLLSTGATLDIANSSSLSIGAASGLVNDGVVRVNATAGFNFTLLRFGVPAPLSGSGVVRLNASNNLSTAYIETTGLGVVQQQSPHRIVGTGRITARVENASAIVADVSGATLEINGQLTQTASGVLRADSGIISLGNGAEIVGGSINGLNGGSWSVNSSPSISAVTSNLTGTVLNNSALRILAGGFANNAVLHVNNAAGANFTRIRIEAPCTLSGVGSVNLRSIDNLDTAYFESTDASAVLTQGPSHQITGSGRIYSPMVNQGTIRATVPARALEVRSTITQSGAGSIIGDNADAALGNSAFVSGGSLATVGIGRVRVTGEATVSGVHNQGKLTLDNNTILHFKSPGIWNWDTLTVNTTAGVNFTRIKVDEFSSVFGSGSIVLNAGANLDTAYIESVSADAKLWNTTPHTIRGTGRIYSPMLNDGVIRADVAAKVLEIRSEVTQTAGGIIEGNQGIAGLGNGAIIRGGILNSVGSGVVRSTGNAAVDGVSNTGLFHLANNTRVGVLANGITNNASIQINDGVGVSFTSLTADAAAFINGTGTLTLRANTNPDTAYIDGLANGLTNGQFHTITGNGRLYGKLGNHGKIKGSNVAGEIVRIRGALTQSSSGSLIGGVGAVALESGSVTGGAFESTGGPVRVLSGESSAASVENKGHLQIDNNGRLVLTDFLNNGTVTVNDGVGGNFTALVFPGVQSLGGQGSITLNANANLNTAYLEVTGDGSVLTIGEGQTLRGTGRLYGTYVSKALLSPGLTEGAIGRFEPRGPLTLAPESRIDIDIAGGDPGQFDAIASNSAVAIGGSLDLAITGWDPSDPCISIPIISGTVITGEFFAITIDSPEPPAGRVWRLDYELNKVSLRLTCAADLNGDCIVDDRDFTKFIFAYNLLDCADPAMPQNCPSDLNHDGVVDDADFTIWIVAYNELICAAD